MTFLHFYFVLG